ncbi:alpha/beta hydrolase [Kocuria sediminis]|uniref:Alpha/beta hydrolase n=1 Tax=Kocuria sediminis TaxID=1038857 RepID=A0A6N8GF98_9MICC|nr:alpha/beta hydrolase [Kocuria sediminis]MUN61821.1 alpha/beta hydrolase [Kocuria sediminis]
MIPRRLTEAGANLAAWAQDYAYALRWQAAGVLGRWDPAHYRAPADPDRTPVVLIPGIYESWTFLLPVAGLLREHGHDVHVVEDLKFNTGTIEEMAELVAAHLRTAGVERCVLVAHSKGGLIGKHLLAHHNRDGGIHGLVAVNTPFSGSELARLLPLSTIRVFLPHSPELTALTTQQAVNRDIVSIYGRFDPHIPGGSRLEGAHNVQLETRGHFLPLNDPRVHRAILEGIRTLTR